MDHAIEDAFRNYLLYGFCPGGFCTAVLANDLSATIWKAHPDLQSADALAALVKWVHFNIPECARGSYEIVNDWIANKEHLRETFAEYYREKQIEYKLATGKELSLFENIDSYKEQSDVEMNMFDSFIQSRGSIVDIKC